MTIGCIIQARMGSTRLPGKVMMKLDKENPMLYYVVSQLKYSKHIEKIIIATSNLPEDKQIVDYANQIGISCFQGSQEDVLDRYYQCAKQFNLSTIVRITSDCPLMDPTIIDNIIETYTSSSFDYVCMHKPRTLPEGVEPEIFSFSVLENAWKNAKRQSEREHVTAYFYHNPNKFQIFNLKNPKNLSFIRLTVDRLNDFQLIQNIISQIQKRPIVLSDVLKLYSEKPEIFEINKDAIPDEGYIKSLQKDEEYYQNK